MSAVAGVFTSRESAQQALNRLWSAGLTEDRFVLLTPDSNHSKVRQGPLISDTEQPGMGKAMGGVIGSAAGVAGGVHIGALAAASAAVPGVGPVIALGILGGAILGLTGARMGGALEDRMAKGLPADELFVYEDALRKGHSVVIAFPDKNAKESVQQAMIEEGAQTIDAARQQWWIGLRDAEKERYSIEGRTFETDEDFYRMGFEAALHAENRCKEYDQIHSEMQARVDEFKKQHPDADERAFRQGFERGAAYYQQLCDRDFEEEQPRQRRAS